MEKKEVKKAAEQVEEAINEVADNEKQTKKGSWKKWLVIAGTVILAGGVGLYLIKVKGSGSDEVEEVEPACNESSCCGDCNRNDNNYNNKHYHKH